MVKKYRIQLDRDACIGVTTCVNVDPKNWVMSEDGKVDLIGSTRNVKTGYFIREIDESELNKWKEVAEACPVNVIHIIDLETGKRII